jgi:hypothetical protein
MSGPDPAPGEDITQSYAWRFRDPAFVAIWTRWHQARDAWGKTWEGLNFAHGGRDSRFAPVPDLIPDRAQRAAAGEYLAARAAYLAELKRRRDP